jgi:hypothetical protein
MGRPQGEAAQLGGRAWWPREDILGREDILSA